MAGTIPYMDLTEFKLASNMPAAFIDDLEAHAPGFVDYKLLERSAYINTRLNKRYDAPFQAPYPIAVKSWLARIVTFECWLKRGVSATDEQFVQYRDQYDAAESELKEAADSDTGLFDLPLRANTDASGVTRSFPLGYSEQSPYKWTDIQSDIGRQEDRGCR